MFIRLCIVSLVLAAAVVPLALVVRAIYGGV